MLRSPNFWVAVVILLAAALWFVPGLVTGEDLVEPAKTLAQANTENEALADDFPPTKVRGRVSVATNKQRTQRLSGITENKRTVVVRAEVGGLVTERLVEKGDTVREGQPLCALERKEREARVEEAKDALREALLEFDGQTALKTSGLQIERQIAAAQSRVTQAKTQLIRNELDLERSTINAPFPGFIEEVAAEAGDLLQPGAACVTLIDLDPMKVVAQVSENNVHQFIVGTKAQAQLPSGRVIEGTVSFVGQQSDETTRTFQVEALVDNSDFSIRSGLTADLLVPLQTYLAHQVPTALLSLDAEGTIGVRVVDNLDQVKFQQVEIVTEDENGVWVTGLPNVITLITVGQDFVTEGESVEVEYEDEI